MTRVILHRVLIAIPALLVMSMLTFALVSLVPGDAAVAILGPEATAEQVRQLREQLLLDHSLPVQYWNWLTTLGKGSLGTSVMNGEPVTQILNERLPVTLALVVGTILVSAVIGVSLGAFSALRGGFAARVVDILSFLGSALPTFWIALLLVVVFAVKLRALPATGYTPLGVSVSGWAVSLILPICALAVQGVTGKAVQARDSVKDVLARDFVRVQVANGFSRRSIVMKHVLRGAAPAITTIIGLVFVGSLSGTVVIEVVFALPGIGQTIVNATVNHDIPVIQGAVLYFTAIVLIVNLITDVLYVWVDPRVRVG